MVDANNGAGYSVGVLVEMKRKHEGQQTRRSELDQTIRAYLGDRFGAEDQVLFQQVDLNGPSVDAMFVDVPAGCTRESPLAPLLTGIAHEFPGDPEVSEEAAGLVVTGAAQALLHPLWAGNAVVVGGPGQGKSTLLQYVCQFHRARRLGRNAYSAGEAGLRRSSSVPRVAIRIDLRKYALWADQDALTPTRKKKQSHTLGTDRYANWRSLETYVIKDIQSHIGAHTFTASDLAVLLATEPVLLALDGLDEVASVSVRDRVTSEIARVHDRIAGDAANLVVLVATRPGSSLSALSTTRAFPTLFLRRLSQGLRLQYLQRWVTVSGLSPESSAKLQATFMDNQHVPHIRELASYPMQLAILLHLLHRRQLLPQQRTELYRDYLKTFLDREQTEDKEPLMADQRQVMEDAHAYLGWYLQMRAEQGLSSGSLPREELRLLLRDHLAGQPNEQELADQLFSAITTRVLCLVERDAGFEFEVQSLREYFAALYIFDNLSPKAARSSRDDGLNALLERPYWSNVTRFFIGMLAKGEVRALKDNLRLVGKKVAPNQLIRSMAVLALNDRTYDGHPEGSIRDIVDVVLDGPGVVFAEDGALDTAGTPLKFSDRAGRKQAVAHLKTRLESFPHAGIGASCASSLFRHAIEDDELAPWWWSNLRDDDAWLQTAAALRVLPSLTDDQEAQLHGALLSSAPEAEWRTALLVRGGYDGKAQALRELVIGELNDGAARGTPHETWSTDTALLIRSAAAAEGNIFVPIHAKETAANLGPGAEQEERHKERATRRSNDAFDAASSAGWQRQLFRIATEWGDGWILRRAVSTIPGNVTILDSGALANAHNSDLARALEGEAGYRSNRGNTDWWLDALASSTSDLWRRLWLVGLLSHAHTNVVIELASFVDEIVSVMFPRHFHSVEAALHSAASSGRMRRLTIEDSLRLGQLEIIDARSLWLIRSVATTAAVERIDTRLSSRFAELLRTGAVDGLTLIEATRSKKKHKVESFQGTRGVLPPSGWASTTKLTVLSATLASDVLTNPSSWPADIVQMASDVSSSRLAKRTKPLAEVAEADGWFDKTS